MSAQPTLSTASEQALKYGYPTWSLLTSTPNGTQGTGAFFYEYWQRSIPSDDVFDIDYNVTEKDEKNANFIFEKFKDNADDIMKQTGTNGFQAEILYKNKILLKTDHKIKCF